MFEYCVVKNVENIKVFEIINACHSETLCDGEKPISYLNSGEKILSESHEFLSETKKSFFFCSSVLLCRQFTAFIHLTIC